MWDTTAQKHCLCDTASCCRHKKFLRSLKRKQDAVYALIQSLRKKIREGKDQWHAFHFAALALLKPFGVKSKSIRLVVNFACTGSRAVAACERSSPLIQFLRYERAKLVREFRVHIWRGSEFTRPGRIAFCLCPFCTLIWLCTQESERTVY